MTGNTGLTAYSFGFNTFFHSKLLQVLLDCALSYTVQLYIAMFICRNHQCGILLSTVDISDVYPQHSVCPLAYSEQVGHHFDEKKLLIEEREVQS